MLNFNVSVNVDRNPERNPNVTSERTLRTNSHQAKAGLKAKKDQRINDKH